MPSYGGHSGSTPPGAGDPAGLVGVEIGDYEIIREIGRGGMGSVFQARQKSLNRIVALKILSSGLGLTPTLVLRFQREAEAAASLHHTNIVPIHAQGESNGLYYYTMELIRGENLHDLISRARGAAETVPSALAETEPLDPEARAAMDTTSQAIPGDSGVVAASDLSLSRGAPRTSRQFEKIAGLIAAVADALDYAHAHGVIHRDIKPHNLILGEDERIYVSDFGLARVLEQPGVTTTGEFVGSPLYMSPEQIVGGQRKVDKRTDIYSLGATMYEWLTLSPPYPGQTREQVISKIITSETPAPRTLNPHIPVDLETICLKTLEKDPDHRYATAGELHDDLQRFLDHQAIRAKRAGLLTRARKFAMRNKVASVVAAALAVAVTLSFALAHQAWLSRSREQAIAVSEQTTEALEQKTAELHETVKAKEEEIAETRIENELLRALLESPEAARFIQKGFSGQERDPLAQRMSCVLIDRQRAREAQRLETRLGPGEGAAHDLYLQALASEELARAASLVKECLRLVPGHVGGEMLAAALACADQDYERMSDHAAVVVQRQPDNPDGYLLRGLAKLMSGGPAAGILDFSAALGRDAGAGWAVVLRGVAYHRVNDHTQALRDLDRALTMTPDNDVALLERARVHLYLENLEAAIADAGRVVELDENNLEAYVLRGDCYDALGRYAESAEDYTRAITLDPVSARIGVKLWQAVAKQQKMREAEEDEAAGVKVPDVVPEPEEPASAPEIAPGTGAGGHGRFDWLKRLLERDHHDPTDRFTANRRLCNHFARVR